MAKQAKKKLCIVGTAGSKSQAPYTDDSFEIWATGTAQVYDDVKRIDRLFEFHPKRYWGIPAVMERLNEFKGELMMQEHYEEIPNSQPYPYDAVRKQFYLPIMGESLFVTNSITWIILLAIHEGYRDISLFGVHMAHDTEYGYQQASCSWALGIIHAKMMAGEIDNLYIAEESELLKARYEYGFFEPTRTMAWVQKRQEALDAELKRIDGQLKSGERQRWLVEGARQESKIIYDRIAGLR